MNTTTGKDAESGGRDDGGPAFPWGEHGDRLGGMSLRDWFAGQILAGAMVHSAGMEDAPDDVLCRLSKCVYRVADAMLAARGKT